MDLKKILISNYKSIESVEIPINRINGSLTFSLLGINESGKSSILKGISFIDNSDLKFPLDFGDPYKPVETTFHYTLESDEKKNLIKHFETKYEAPKKFTSQLDVELLELKKSVANIASLKETKTQTITFKNYLIKGFEFVSNKIIPNKEGEIYLEDFFDDYLPDYFWNEKHSVVFWKSEDKYLISGPINLATFSSNPENTSIPLLNCFRLVGIKPADIPKEITKLSDPTAITNLVDRLNDKVTEHIKNVWSGHPISIKFNINNNHISFLVEDDGVKYEAKVTSQRSDGFRQFISFLLTLSIEKRNESLSYKILILDEPETHLHPTAQIDLKDELLEITKDKSSNNIVFYATHSNYLIDKSNLNRSFTVKKVDNKKTELEPISKIKTSYSEINYEVFDIATNDYHNELYGFIEANDKSKLEAIDKDRDWYNARFEKKEKVSIATYVRHSIHHPENEHNQKVRETTLIKSIKILRDIKESLQSQNT